MNRLEMLESLAKEALGHALVPADAEIVLLDIARAAEERERAAAAAWLKPGVQPSPRAKTVKAPASSPAVIQGISDILDHHAGRKRGKVFEVNSDPRTTLPAPAVTS